MAILLSSTYLLMSSMTSNCKIVRCFQNVIQENLTQYNPNISLSRGIRWWNSRSVDESSDDGISAR